MDTSEFYCKACKVHMNSQFMWDSHINGKKHIKKVNKDTEGDGFEAQDDTPGEEEDISENTENTPAKIEETIKDVSEPIVGLDYVIELQYPDVDIHPSYSCTLCKCTIGVMAVIDHITSTKHRMNYVEQKDHDGFQILENMQSSGVPLDGLAEVRAATLEQKYGRGNVKVKLEKSKFGSISGMRKRPQQNMNENLSQSRTQMPYSSFHSLELNAAERQFLAQIPYFETNTKLQMLEQLSLIDLSDDNEAKDTMNMITCIATLLRRYKSVLHAKENPRVSVSNRSQGMPMPSRDPNMGYSQREQNMPAAQSTPMPSPIGTREPRMAAPSNYGTGMNQSGEWNQMGIPQVPNQMRQSYNEPVSYPQPMANRGAYSATPTYRNPYTPRTSYM